MSAVRHGYTAFAEGDVLFAKITPCMENGKGCHATGLRNGIGFGSTEFHVLRARAGAEPRYVYQWTKSRELRKRAANAMVGSAGQQRVPAAFLTSYPIPHHSGREQSAIARVLDCVDRAIEETEALLAKQERLRAGLLHDLLTRGLDADGRLRDPATHRFKPSPLGPIPVEWEVGSLVDATDPDRQPILTGPFGADLGTDDFVPDGVAVLRIGNVQHGYLDLTDLLFITPTKADQLRRYMVRSGDLLFARQGASTGRNALADERVQGFLINYHIIRVALDPSRCAPAFIEAMLNSDVAKRQVDREKGRSTREGINTEQLRELRMPLAPPSEQRAIAEVLSIQQRHRAEILAHVDGLRRLKAGLMEDLLTGRVPVTPLLEGGHG